MHADRLTVVIVHDFAHVDGGAGQVAISSARELARRGHSVILFSAVPPSDPSLKQAGIRVVCTQQMDILKNPDRIAAAIQGVWNREAAVCLTALLSSLDARNTVVHIHGWTKALSSSIVPVALARGVGIVITIHDHFLACPNGGFFNYVSKQICHLKPMSLECLLTNCDSRSYAQKLWRVVRQGVQISCGQLPGAIHHFIFISEFSRSIMEGFLPVGATIHEISNPIDFDKLPAGNPSLSKFAIYVGRLAEEKGPLLVAEAASRAGRDLRFVGDGYLRSEIEKRYPECQITGWVSRDNVRKQIENSRSLVFPSLLYENQGLVVLEASACGIPAIVADTSAARDSVRDGETGLWFRGGDLDDLTRKLNALADNELVGRLGRAAYDCFWSAAPTLGRHADQLELCYAQVLARRT